MEWTQLFTIALGAILVNNFIVAQFLGICPFMGVSKKIETASGMGLAVIFVMGLASAICWPINELILVPMGLTFMQTVTYIPHFISLVVICGLIRQFSLSGGVFNDIIAFFGGTRTPLLQHPEYFRTIYVASGIWQEVGWSSIIYLAALTSVDPQLYEAAEIDGAGRLRQTWHITLPGILPVIVMLLILQMGSILNVGYEKCLLLYNESTFATADIIATYVYRKGLIDANFSYSTAVGLFNSVVNLLFLSATNWISNRATGIGLF